MDGTQDILIIPFGDLHLGNKNCNKTKIKEYIDWIKHTPRLYWIGMGDYADAITHSDERRYDFDSLDPELPTPDEQYAWVRAEFAKIKTNCLGLHIGNHDFELQRRHEHRYVKMDLCDSLELPFLGYNAMTRLKFILKKRNGERMHRNGGTITIASTHGSTNARTAGGKINPMLLWASGLLAAC